MINNHTKNIEKTWDTIAKSFDTTRNKPWEQCLDFIQTLSNKDTILDVGCGNGRHLIPCAQHCNKALGLDLSSELLKIVKNKLIKNNIRNTILLHSNMIHLPFKNESIDGILYIASLHNIKYRKRRIQSLKEIKRILKNNGRGLISVWSRWQDKYRAHFYKKRFAGTNDSEFGDIEIYWKQHGLNIPRFYHLYSKKEFIRDLEIADIKILRLNEVKIHSKKYPDNYFAEITKL
jgi:ubiquinone/menaquinone biosynthesis C-methylase UbiE